MRNQKKGKWQDDNNYLCSCGQLLKNTCQSMIRKHRQTKKHHDWLNKEFVKVEEPKYKVIKESVTITFD